VHAIKTHVTERAILLCMNALGKPNMMQMNWPRHTPRYRRSCVAGMSSIPAMPAEFSA